MKIFITQDTDWIKKEPQEDVLKRYVSDHKPRIPSLMRTFEELEVSKEEVDEVLEKYKKIPLRKILGKKKNLNVVDKK